MARLHALDPEPVRGQLEAAGAAVVPVGSRLAITRELASEFGRPDLAQAAQWLIDHPARPAPDVICHADLHPFNLLRDGARVTLLDWSTALLAPREYDVASTSLALSEAALTAPGWLRSPLRWTGRRIAGRFVRSYQASTGVVIDRAGLVWHQAAVCLRALVEVSGWVHSGQQNARGGHPWMTSCVAIHPADTPDRRGARNGSRLVADTSVITSYSGMTYSSDLASRVPGGCAVEYRSACCPADDEPLHIIEISGPDEREPDE